ncbi:MAG: diguanylate cyclase [Planctomycetaceae bacterium]|nr:diguanylate cyclase [Planctomycetaceae bacterium]
MKTEDNTLTSVNVLVADDDPAILRLLTHLLEQGGHHVRTAADGNQCLQMILQDCPDVLITDWVMPGLDGLEICRRVRQLHARKVLPHYTYILLLTALSGKKSFIEGLESGADDFVEKSVGSLSDLRIEIMTRLKAALRTRKLEIDLEFAAKYDSLTQLLNRVTFFELAQVTWDRSIKNKFPLSVVMFDCDFFKRVNDIHGHQAGDTVLREMASILRGFSRSSDVICRYGGEEFCGLLPGCNEKTAWNWAERIRQQFESNPIRHGNIDIAITASFGIAERKDDTTVLDQLIEHADQALLFAKESGRNSCVRFTETLVHDSDISRGPGINELFRGVTAADVMTPFTLTINATETVASVVDFFLKTRIDALPVVNSFGKLIGMVSEMTFIPLIGNLSRWKEPVGDLVSRNIISYPVDTPLRVIFNFLCRVSAKQILLIDDDVPVGYINRTPLLLWLRNQWAVTTGRFSDIVHAMQITDLPYKNLKDSVGELMKELSLLDEAISKNTLSEDWEINRDQLVALISRSQDIMDNVLKLTSQKNNTSSGNLAQLGFGG